MSMVHGYLNSVPEFGVRVSETCRLCGEQIHITEGVYVDSTGGDVCCADKFTEKNENGQHQTSCKD